MSVVLEKTYSPQEAQRVAKGNLKNVTSSETDGTKTKAQLKAEKKTLFENDQKAAKDALNKSVTNPEADDIKTKAQLKSERRALQEAQRAVKEKAKNLSKTDLKKLASQLTDSKIQIEKKKNSNKKGSDVMKCRSQKEHEIINENLLRINLFKHLYTDNSNVLKQLKSENVIIHPEILRLGTEYAEKTIIGSNARCEAFLAAVIRLLKDYERPQNVDFIKGFELCLNNSVKYLNCCRPFSVTMQNALKNIKKQLTSLPPKQSDEEAKSKLISSISVYIDVEIILADKAISSVMQQQISDGDVILIYGFSSLIHKIFREAISSNKKFRVLIIDSRPQLEGRESLRQLTQLGIECSYYLINAVRYTLSQLQVSKIFLGVHAILANGVAMSRVGSAQIALEARGCNVPVIVACETHKSSECARTDSIVYNEIGNPDNLIKSTLNTFKPSPLTEWNTRKNLNLLNIFYDVIPADLMTAIITELEPVLPSARI